MLVNNEVGEKAFERVKEKLIWKQTKLEDRKRLEEDTVL